MNILIVDDEALARSRLRTLLGDLPRGHGIALANVRARLALLHDVQGEFSAGVQDGLYQVRITLPAPAAPRPAAPAHAPRTPARAAPAHEHPHR